MLHSISIVESGRLDEVEKKIYPWPWAVNVEGAPYYFNDEQSAIHFVRTKLAAGVKSIDVGCNQISLLHHGKNFPSLNHAFNPYHNSRYAAEFLQSNYNESKNWFTAVGGIILKQPPYQGNIPREFIKCGRVLLGLTRK